MSISTQWLALCSKNVTIPVQRSQSNICRIHSIVRADYTAKSPSHFHGNSPFHPCLFLASEALRNETAFIIAHESIPTCQPWESPHSLLSVLLPGDIWHRPMQHLRREADKALDTLWWSWSYENTRLRFLRNSGCIVSGHIQYIATESGFPLSEWRMPGNALILIRICDLIFFFFF